MRKLLPVLIVFVLGIGIVKAQTALDPQKFVNAQIAADTLADGSHDPAKTVYTVQSGQYYAFDGTLNCNFDLTITGPDKGWILHDANPPVFFQTPSASGAARDMINLNAGGSITLKNILLTGLHGNDVNISSFVRNFAGNKIIWDNCAFSDHRDHCTRSTGATQEISITNCVFINGDRRGSSPFGGMPFRLDAACAKLTFENNTVVNAARLFGNGGNFFTSNMTEIHNTILNQQVNGHEIHWYTALQANNIYYNWSWRGRNLRTNGYEAPFTTFETFSGVKEKLDSISLYEGKNAFYLDPAFPAYWNSKINPGRADSDKVIMCFLWNLDVDSTILADTDFKIGKNYWQIDPMFTNNPSKVDSMKGWDLANWDANVTHYPDWRITPPITWNPADGTPILNWPPDFDLTYSEEHLLKAGTDGLPLGDLNWYPTAKATYMANRTQYIAALQDSMSNAKYVYVPGDSVSAFITADMLTAVKSFNPQVPDQYYLSNNYPNPFNPTTTIKIGLPQQSNVTLTVFNVLGQKVFEVTENNMASGVHTFDFNASRLSSGVYVYRINAVGLNGKNFTSSKKMMLLK